MASPFVKASTPPPGPERAVVPPQGPVGFAVPSPRLPEEAPLRRLLPPNPRFPVRFPVEGPPAANSRGTASCDVAPQRGSFGSRAAAFTGSFPADSGSESSHPLRARCSGASGPGFGATGRFQYRTSVGLPLRSFRPGPAPFVLLCLRLSMGLLLISGPSGLCTSLCRPLADMPEPW